MNVLMCPVCGNKLDFCLKYYKCKNNHSFDISKKGYVNLLMSNASSEKRHGDDKAMVEARRDFLNKGYYLPLAQKISEICADNGSKSTVIFECGCGDCYYINQVKEKFDCCGKAADLYGCDISKDVLPYGKKRIGNITLFVASAYKLPLLDNSVDIALSVFAPMDMNEFGRIVKQGGTVIKVIPLENHLLELKNQLYDNVYLNRPVIDENSNFQKELYTELKYRFALNTADEIDKLFKMTPYYYKTGELAQKRLKSINQLTVTASFGIIKYKKI